MVVLTTYLSVEVSNVLKPRNNLLFSPSRYRNDLSRGNRHFRRNLAKKQRLVSDLRIDGGSARIVPVEHHLTHAASAMFCAPFEDAAVVTIDGVGEWTTATMGKATANLTQR